MSLYLWDCSLSSGITQQFSRRTTCLQGCLASLDAPRQGRHQPLPQVTMRVILRACTPRQGSPAWAGFLVSSMIGFHRQLADLRNPPPSQEHWIQHTDCKQETREEHRVFEIMGDSTGGTAVQSCYTRLTDNPYHP